MLSATRRKYFVWYWQVDNISHWLCPFKVTVQAIFLSHQLQTFSYLPISCCVCILDTWSSSGVGIVGSVQLKCKVLWLGNFAPMNHFTQKFPNLNSNKWPMSGNVNEKHGKKIIIMINNKYFEGAPAYRWGCCWSPVVAGVAKWRPLHFGRKCRPLGGPQAKRGKFDIEVNKTPYFFFPPDQALGLKNILIWSKIYRKCFSIFSEGSQNPKALGTANKKCHTGHKNRWKRICLFGLKAGGTIIFIYIRTFFPSWKGWRSKEKYWHFGTSVRLVHRKMATLHLNCKNPCESQINHGPLSAVG